MAGSDDVGPHDYGPPMHDGQTAFSSAADDTITPPAGVMIGQHT